jgi:hypothetical protein
VEDAVRDKKRGSSTDRPLRARRLPTAGLINDDLLRLQNPVLRNWTGPILAHPQVVFFSVRMASGFGFGCRTKSYRLVGAGVCGLY